MYEAGQGKFPYKRGKYTIVIGRKDGFEVTFHTERDEYTVTKDGKILRKGICSLSDVKCYLR